MAIVYGGNGHQPNAALSTSKLDAVFSAWQRKGFSLVDRSTWGRCSHASAFPTGAFSTTSFSWAPEDIPALTYFAKLLHVDLSTAADATRHLLLFLASHPTGEMAVSVARDQLVSLGIKCKKHGKVNEYLNALAQAGWIEQVNNYVIKRKGRQWRIGERMRQKFTPTPSTNNKPPPPSILCPLSDSEAVNNVQDDPRNDLLDGDVWFVDGTLMAETAMCGPEGSEHAT